MFANPQTVDMSVVLPDGGLSASQRQLYVLTPPRGDGGGGAGSHHHPLQSKMVALNGQTLAFVGDAGLPPLDPPLSKGGGPLVLPALSYGFVVVPDANVTACMVE
jgi:hypothetical protein